MAEAGLQSHQLLLHKGLEAARNYTVRRGFLRQTVIGPLGQDIASHRKQYETTACPLTQPSFFACFLPYLTYPVLTPAFACHCPCRAFNGLGDC